MGSMGSMGRVGSMGTKCAMVRSMLRRWVSRLYLADDGLHLA